MALGAILLTMFICSGILITYLIYENRVLNEDRKKVIAVNNQQMNLITEREEIIQSYIRKVEEQDKLIKISQLSTGIWPQNTSTAAWKTLQLQDPVLEMIVPL